MLRGLECATCLELTDPAFIVMGDLLEPHVLHRADPTAPKRTMCIHAAVLQDAYTCVRHLSLDGVWASRVLPTDDAGEGKYCQELPRSSLAKADSSYEKVYVLRLFGDHQYVLRGCTPS